MTLKNLFRSVEFENILPYIIEYDPEIAGSTLSLKQAFDSIRIITPRENKQKETICVSYFNDVDGSEGFSIRNCSNDRFDVVAARRIETAPDLNLPLNRLAAYCLWELTYWGFSEEETAESFRLKTLSNGSPTKNRYEKEFAEKTKQWFPSVAISSRSIFQKSLMNRQKRKREFRHEQRLRQLLRYAKIEELCSFLTGYNVKGVTVADLWTLKDVAGFTVTTDQSYSEDAELAEQYMCDLYEKYCCINYDIVRTIAIITGGASVSRALNNLRNTILKLMPEALIGIGDRSHNQISVTIIYILS